MYGFHKHSIYGLKTIGSDDIIYVGLSSYPEKRFWNHKSRFGKDIEMVILDTFSKYENKDNASDTERWWIKFMLDIGHPLVNKAIRKPSC